MFRSLEHVGRCQDLLTSPRLSLSAVTGILAPSTSPTRSNHMQRNQAASRENWEQSSKLCVQYLAPIIKNANTTSRRSVSTRSSRVRAPQ